ncbi:hypothetical protein OY671_001026 [Metschnikowia pulcherrima]|nr:hypothetical protein OY671_001026 [Metschnikowia pulcherrima]
MKSKFLVLYPSAENIDSIIKKANLQHAKNGPFSAVIMLGSCLPTEMPTTVPDAPTYFFGNSEEEGKFVDIGQNFTCVTSRSAFLKLECGITLAFLNDTLPLEDESETNTKADVLFSYDWPYCIAAHQKLTLVGNRKVDEFVKQIQPRYHFAVGSEMGKVYEHSTVAWSPTRSYRFVSLAREGSGNKWFYAFGIDNGNDEVSSPDTNPFLEDSTKRERESEKEVPVENYRLQRLKNDEPSTKRVKVVAPSDCFFCLSNPKLESHMIVSIGQFSYLTVAKGPLTRPGRELDFSGHAIIIPIEHSPTLTSSVELEKEIEQYKQSLTDAFDEKGFDVIFYEIGRPENVHFHIQMVPVPKGLIGKMFERALDEKSRINNETFEYNSKLNFKKYSATDVERENILKLGNYVQFTVCADKTKVYYITALEGDKSLDLQFPRRVLAFLLRLPKRVRWDRCRQTTAQETIESQKFKQFYEKHDFTR